MQALRIRVKKAKASRKPHTADLKPGIVIENVAQTRRLAETTLGTSALLPASGGGSSYIEEGPTCTGSGSQVRSIFSLVRWVSSKKGIFLSKIKVLNQTFLTETTNQIKVCCQKNNHEFLSVSMFLI